MAGHSRPKDGVASARLCPAIHVSGRRIKKDASRKTHQERRIKKDVDARDKRGHDVEG
jgi:hypothetical protein